MFVSVETSGEVALVRIDRPPANANNLELLDELVGALEALACDLDCCMRLSRPDAVLARALELASEMVPFPPDVYAATKRELRSRTTSAIAAGVESEPLLEGWLSPKPVPQ